MCQDSQVPQREGPGEVGQLAKRTWARRTLFPFFCHSHGLGSICLLIATRAANIEASYLLTTGRSQQCPHPYQGQGEHGSIVRQGSQSSRN